MQCRLCGKDSRDMGECDNCWEVYTRLRGMSKDLVLKLLKEAEIDYLVEREGKDG